MVKLLVYFMVLCCTFSVFASPWIAALSYSIVSILQPHHIWFWAFDSISIFKVTAGLSIVGFAIQAFKQNIDYSVYKSPQYLSCVGILVFYHLSSYFTPFKVYNSLTSSSLVIDVYTTIIIMYTVVLGLIKQPKVLNYFAVIFVFTTIYFAYWANDHYFSSNWAQFHQGRLMGLRFSAYRDGNHMAIVLTCGMAFVLFGVKYFERKWLKLLMILSIPFIWNALVLYASRGALLSAACVTLFFAMVVKNKSLNILVVAGFILMLIYQGGMLTQRTKSTVTASQSEEREQPINPRIRSWQIGWHLATKHPLFGVGPQAFTHASKFYFPDEKAYVAHNTFLNYSGNLGVFAGFLYLFIFYRSYKQYKYVNKVSTDNTAKYLNYSCAGGLVGFFVGAFFLDMIIFEPFYLMILVLFLNYYFVRKRDQETLEEPNENNAENVTVDKRVIR